MRRNFFYNKFSEMEIQIFLKKIEYERITRLVTYRLNEILNVTASVYVLF